MTRELCLGLLQIALVGQEEDMQCMWRSVAQVGRVMCHDSTGRMGYESLREYESQSEG